MKSIVFIFVLSLVLLLSIGQNEQTCIETNGEILCSEPPISPLDTEHKIFLPIIGK